MPDKQCIRELDWCMQYGHRFPDDVTTARHFIDMGDAERAADRAELPEHFDAIKRASEAAQSILALVKASAATLTSDPAK